MTKPISRFNLILYNEDFIVSIKPQCWMCDTVNNITRHHVIPKRFKPVKNIIIPLCKLCHRSLERSYHTYKT